MRNAILSYPKQIEAAFTNVAQPDLSSLPSHPSMVIIAGMGGSALPGELLTIAARRIALRLPVHIHRTYGLPSYADNKALLFTVSYSGNTEETLSVYEEAVAKGFTPISITVGGRLKELAHKNGTPLFRIPDTGIQPRQATGYLFVSVLRVLEAKNIVVGVRKQFTEAAQKIRAETFEEYGKELARRVKGKIPLLYASQDYKALAYIFKIKFNENSKTHAFANYFPELNHNELVGYTDPADRFYTLILQADDEHERIAKRMRISAELIREKGHNVEIVPIEGKTIFEKIISSMVLSDWVSYYLALEYGVDPEPVEIIEGLKKKLQNS